MANPTTRTRSAGSAGRRTLTAAARAAAKRAERGATTDDVPEDRASGRTVLVEAPKNGWEDPPEPSPEDFEETPPRERGTSRHRKLLTAALCVLLVAGLVAVGVLGWQYWEARRAQQARGEAMAAARKAAPVVLSYDYRHLDRDFARARALLTGKFAGEYRKTTTAVVGPTAKKYHGVVKATVATASVVSAAPDKVVVLLFANQITESTRVSGSRLDLNRVRMTMARTDEGWKVSAVDAL
ncbi:hypothetical protein [Streptomyces cupreus]|uniref:Mce-associated membrane protein n=1 Tax=Streptomyces cupreus TaxID=2759956 RepID=A0A7X1M944_9ACTN|nr:hypothetical protein [Streptomyces cupreus]MBC2902258.1 hypothetical protein [Streptomyces cupreus]